MLAGRTPHKLMTGARILDPAGLLMRQNASRYREQLGFETLTKPLAFLFGTISRSRSVRRLSVDSPNSLPLLASRLITQAKPIVCAN